jgi:hypothetical protein
MRGFWLSGTLALAFAVGCGAAQAMSFRLAPMVSGTACHGACPTAIVAEGEITDETPAEFMSFVGANARGGDVRSIVLLNSQGGKVVAAMKLGRMFRAVGAAAIVARAAEGDDGRTHIMAGRCFSACVYALMGGRKRVVPSQSLVGIHRMFALDSGVDPSGDHARQRRYDDGGMRNTLAKYSSDMGVSRDLINKAEQTSTDSIHILSQREIARWRLGSSRF